MQLVDQCWRLLPLPGKYFIWAITTTIIVVGLLQLAVRYGYTVLLC